jgi:hypothetical protein
MTMNIVMVSNNNNNDNIKNDNNTVRGAYVRQYNLFVT